MIDAEYVRRLETRLADLERRVMSQFMSQADPGPVMRLAQIFEVPTGSSTNTTVHVYKIKFIDMHQFSEAATHQGPVVDFRDEDEEYYAATTQDMSLSVDDIVRVAWYNGRWWIQFDGGLLIGKTSTTHAKGTEEVVNVWRTDGDKGDEAFVLGDTIVAYNRFANLSAGLWVICLYVQGGWEIIVSECPP